MRGSSPVAGASIAFVRIAFGLMLAFEMVQMLRLGLVGSHYADPSFHFTYPGLEWVRPWPGIGMYVHFGALAVLALLMAVGLFYRAAAGLFALGFIHVFLIDRALYLNHFYLIALLACCLALARAADVWSLDVTLRGKPESSVIPLWNLLLLRFHVALPYFFGGLAKLNADWVVRHEPMGLWLRNNAAEVPLLREFAQWSHAPAFFSWGGLAFDLTVVPLLMWRKTRPFAFLLVVAFNLMNAAMFHIGVFPWLMIAASTIFFEPDWPRRVLGRLGLSQPQERDERHAFQPRRWLAPVLCAYAVLHVLLPLRHFLYPGNVQWTEEASRFSWQMMSRTKSGHAIFLARDPVSGDSWIVDVKKRLTARQYKKMATDPDLLRQMANHLSRNEREGSTLRIYARAEVSLNGRPPAPLVDEKQDLGSEPCSQRPAPWILR